MIKRNNCIVLDNLDKLDNPDNGFVLVFVVIFDKFLFQKNNFLSILFYF